MAEKKILIIEDDFDTAVMVDDMVRERGYRPVIAYDGLSGLDLALQEQLDLILLDLRLPRLSGVELLSKLNERQCDVPVVVMTAVGSEELAIHALRMGVRDYVKKPFSAPELLDVIEHALEENRLRHENAQLLENLRESRDRVAGRSADLKLVLNRLVRLQRIALALGAITVGTDLEGVYGRLTEYAAALLDVRRSAILLFDSERQELVCQKPTFGMADEIARDYRIPLGPASPIWDAWENGQSLIANDLVDSPLIRALGLGEHVTQNEIQSTMFSVLRLGERSIGLFQVSDKLDGSPFTSDDLRILEIFASQSAIAIENARLFTREKRRISQMGALTDVAQAVSEAVTKRPQALLERVARGACEMLQADCAVVLPFVAESADTYDVSNVASFGAQNPVTVNPEVVDRDPVNLLHFHNPLVCEDIVRDRPDLLQYQLFKQESARAFVGVLLEAGEVDLGVLYVIFRSPREVDEQEVVSVRLIAHQAALAIARSRLFETLNQHLIRTNAGLRRKLQEMEELQKVGNVVSSKLEIDKVFDRILHGAMSISGAPSAALLVMDEKSGAVIGLLRRDGHTVTKKIDPSRAKSRASSAKGQRAAVTPDATEALVGKTPWLSIYRRWVPDARSFLYVPITRGDAKEQVGLLAIGSPESKKYGPDDLRLLEALASYAAIAIQNARYVQTVRLFRAQQQEAGRIVAMADATGNMVHHINNTVGAMRPLIQQIEMRLDRGTLDEAYLREKLQGIRAGADLTLEVARQIPRPFHSVPVQPIDVNESVAAAWADLRTPAGVEVRFEYDGDLPPVKATRQLDEVFRNLMKNALDAMARTGGVLLVRNLRLDDRFVQVEVHDTGPGISPEIRDKIFQMGITTKRNGVGFGLWWSRMFLRRLGGDVVFESRDGSGCVFKVTLPISDEQRA